MHKRLPFYTPFYCAALCIKWRSKQDIYQLPLAFDTIKAMQFYNQYWLTLHKWANQRPELLNGLEQAHPRVELLLSHMHVESLRIFQ